MNEYVTRPAIEERPHAWVPGEMHIAVSIGHNEDFGRETATRLRGVAVDLLGNIRVKAPERDGQPLVIPAARESDHLLFVPLSLESRDPAVLHRAVGRLNAEESWKVLRDARFAPVGAAPNWFSAAQQYAQGGSPGSLPVPVKPFGGRLRYAPIGDLDLANKAANSAWAADTGPENVHVAVLDTAPTEDDLARAEAKYGNNRHLRDLLGHLSPPIGRITVPELEAIRAAELQRIDSVGFHPVEVPQPSDIRDHGLFVAGVVLATAPWVRIRLIQVLNNLGIGSFNALLVALVGLIQTKRPESPLVVNLSLGTLPSNEQLPDIWFGYPIEGLPGTPANPDLQVVGDQKLASRDAMHAALKDRESPASQALQRIQAPMRQLMATLRAHDCLVVAAAGNDSVFRGVPRPSRWDPRTPAIYDEVLGVAACGIDPRHPARYSNKGELVPAAEPVRDAVATLGGDVAVDGVTPSGGVVGVYSSVSFPPLPPSTARLSNVNGWAEWSGTSFAAPIISGVAANFWATAPADARTTLDKLNSAFRVRNADVADLEVPAVSVSLTWLP